MATKKTTAGGPSPKPAADGPENDPTDVVMKVPVRDQNVKHWFRYHAPDEEAVIMHERVRAAGAGLAEIIVRSCPNGDDRKRSIAAVREAVMWANAAIACKGR